MGRNQSGWRVAGWVAVLAGWAAGGAPMPAPAQPRPSRLAIEIGGYMEQSFGAASNQPGIRVGRQRATGTTTTVLRDPNRFAQMSDAELWFRGRARLADDVTIGLVVQLEANSQTNDQIDESYLFVDTRFGRVLLGTENDAAYQQHVATPRAGAAWGVLESAASAWVVVPRAVQTPSTTAPLTAGDDHKLTYFTPRWRGVQAGLSFTPNEAEDSRDLSDRARERSNLLSLSVNGRWRWNETRLDASFGWVRGAAAPLGSTPDRRAPVDDRALGAQLRHGRYAIGGALRRIDAPGSPRAGSALALGIAWEASPWGVSLAHLGGQGGDGSGLADRSDLLLLSGARELARGVDAILSVFAARHQSGARDAGAEARNQGWGVVSGLRLGF